MLACSGVLTPAIGGTVFVDFDGDNQPSSGEELAGVRVQLYRDDGDGIFEPDDGDLPVGGERTTDSEGQYCFDNLDADEGYFVLQPSQTVNGNGLDRQVAGPIFPGTPGLLIDAFITTQTATAIPPAPSAATSTRVFGDETEVLGQERDIIAVLDSGDGEVRVNVNPFGNRPTMRYNADVAVTGSGTVVWDGIDNDAGQISMGLNGRDLTLEGTQAGLALRMGSVVSGSTARIRIYQGSTANFSDVTFSIPVTQGGAAEAYVFVPFSSFAGNVSPSNVDAIALMLDANEAGGNDIELALIGTNGPKQVHLENVLRTDLSVTNTNERSMVVPGEPVTYTVRVTNQGPSDVTGARITDQVPSILANAAYTSNSIGLVAGNTPVGTGDIDDTVSMSVGSTVTYTLTGTVDSSATGTISNIASVDLSSAYVDTDPTNNRAVDTDPLQPEVDLRITKTNGQTVVRPGQQNTYSIVVTNPGPSDVRGATVVDTFPPTLTAVSYSTSTTGNASSNRPSGFDAIDDTVFLPANSSITYTVRSTVGSNAGDTLSNTATIAPPQDVVERNPDNNSSTDFDTVLREADLSITKTNGRDEVTPGDGVNYTIVVANEGPSDVQAATVRDVFPSALTNVTYTSQTTGNASGSTSGSGSINDVVNLGVGSRITYSVNAIVSLTAADSITNTATVSPPAGITDPVLGNNTARDTDAVDQAFSSISGYVYMDRNDNGVRESDEPGLVDVEITLSGTDLLQNDIHRQARTNLDGLYRFGNLLPGTYAIEETQPSAFPDGKTTAGTGALNNPTVTDNLFSNLQLGRGQEAIDFNFGEGRPSISKRELISSAFRRFDR